MLKNIQIKVKTFFKIAKRQTEVDTLPNKENFPQTADSQRAVIISK